MHLTALIPHLAVSHPSWLYAHTFSMAGLVVYRSPVVKETDEWYAPVAQLLRQVEMKLVLRERIPDPAMMFGCGDLEVYRPRGGHYPDVPVQGSGFLKNLVLTGGK